MMNKKTQRALMKIIKRCFFCAVVLPILVLNIQAQASTELMDQTMVRMINQLDALFPLIDQASRQQDTTARVQFHFDRWVDANGKKHDGLRQSILEIRKALVSEINHTSLTPRKIEPINDDFVGR